MPPGGHRDMSWPTKRRARPAAGRFAARAPLAPMAARFGDEAVSFTAPGRPRCESGGRGPGAAAGAAAAAAPPSSSPSFSLPAKRAWKVKVRREGYDERSETGATREPRRVSATTQSDESSQTDERTNGDWYGTMVALMAHKPHLGALTSARCCWRWRRRGSRGAAGRGDATPGRGSGTTPRGGLLGGGARLALFRADLLPRVDRRASGGAGVERVLCALVVPEPVLVVPLIPSVELACAARGWGGEGGATAKVWGDHASERRRACRRRTRGRENATTHLVWPSEYLQILERLVIHREQADARPPAQPRLEHVERLDRHIGGERALADVEDEPPE